MPNTDHARVAPFADEPEPADETELEPADETELLYQDATTRVSKPSAFDDWYYGIEDKLGQGTIGMAVCLVVFVIILLVAIFFKPI